MALAPLSPRALVFAIFFLQCSSFGGMFARFADLQQQIGLTADQLGLALTGPMVGALLTYPLGPPAVERFGTRRSLLFVIPATAIAVGLLPLAWDTLSLFFVFMLAGFGHGFATMAMNVEADRVEGMTGRRLMNAAHGVWSLGFVLTTLIATVARGSGVSPLVHLGLTVPFVLVLSLLVILPMTAAPPRAHTGPVKRPLFARPTRRILALVVFICGTLFIESGAMVWSVIYFRDAFDVPEWIETVSLPAALLMVALGRLFTDRFVERFGPAKVAGVLALVAFIGLVPVAWAGSLPLAFVGFALMGIGVSVAYPLSISAAARIGDRPAADNVAAYSVIQRALVLVAPAIMGFLAARLGIAGAFAALLPLPFLAIAFARALEPRPILPTVPREQSQPGPAALPSAEPRPAAD